jgi:hypothetical protein
LVNGLPGLDDAVDQNILFNPAIWGWADSGSKCNKISFACSAHKRNAWSEIRGDALSWSMEKLESKGRFPLCPQTRLLLPPNLLKTLTKSRFRDLLHLEFVPALG